MDKALEVIDEYHVKIKQFESNILIAPKMRTLQDCMFNLIVWGRLCILLLSYSPEVHILSGDLVLHKRTLEPIKTLIYGLRRYDVDRVAALMDASNPENANVKPVGYMSHKSKIYLVSRLNFVFRRCSNCDSQQADVHDHMEYILASLDMFANIGENLIDYTFNVSTSESYISYCISCSSSILKILCADDVLQNE